ncbi:hypothetical protein ElyMa_001281800 [Elysia marginata]|uniref:Secreted protein n=1 Tax=Elysia marginata TaxID=1093978 RepID=A0AAV4IHW2_9GAST|nr:hypothetical protein ElyMa_001281800 [Elysia marginata]
MIFGVVSSFLPAWATQRIIIEGDRNRKERNEDDTTTTTMTVAIIMNIKIKTEQQAQLLSCNADAKVVHVLQVPSADDRGTTLRPVCRHIKRFPPQLRSLDIAVTVGFQSRTPLAASGTHDTLDPIHQANPTLNPLNGRGRHTPSGVRFTRYCNVFVPVLSIGSAIPFTAP